MPLVKVILGSTRPGRFGIQPAEWIMQLSKDYVKTDFELVDLAKINLPLLDEPQSARSGEYEHEHSKQWASIVDGADGFVFVTGEYNHGVPAALKNALDFAYHEWAYKPLAFVSYGAEAGGTRAVEHFRASAAQVSMFDIHEQVVIANYWENMDEQGKFIPTDRHTADAKKLLERIGFWSEYLKDARTKLK